MFLPLPRPRGSAGVTGKNRGLEKKPAGGGRKKEEEERNGGGCPWAGRRVPYVTPGLISPLIYATAKRPEPATVEPHQSLAAPVGGDFTDVSRPSVSLLFARFARM